MRLRMIREQEKKLAKELGLQTKQILADSIISEQQKKLDEEYKKKTKLKEELLLKKSELFEKLAEAEAKFIQEQNEEALKTQMSKKRAIELEENQRGRNLKAQADLSRTKKERESKARIEIDRRNSIREAETKRAEKVRLEFAQTKKTEIFDQTADKKATVPFKIMIENFKNTNIRIEEAIKETEEEAAARISKEKAFEEERLAVQERVDKRAKSALRKFQIEREMESTAKLLQAEKAENKIASLKIAEMGNKNRLIFNDSLLEDLFDQFLENEDRVVAMNNLSVKFTEKCFWKIYPEKSQFDKKYLANFPVSAKETENIEKSFSLNYSQMPNENFDGENKGENFAQQNKTGLLANDGENSEDQSQNKDDIESAEEFPEEDLTASLENIDLKKFIDEQEQFLRKLNSESQAIKNQIYNNDSSAEEQEALEEKEVFGDNQKEPEPQIAKVKSGDMPKNSSSQKFISFRNFQDQQNIPKAIQNAGGYKPISIESKADSKDKLSQNIANSPHSLHSQTSETDQEANAETLEPKENQKNPFKKKKEILKPKKEKILPQNETKLKPPSKQEKQKSTQKNKSHGQIEERQKCIGANPALGQPLGEIEEKVEDEISEASNYFGKEDKPALESSEKVSIRQFISSSKQPISSTPNPPAELPKVSQPINTKSEYIRNFIKDFDISISEDDSSDEDTPKFQSSVIKLDQPFIQSLKAASKNEASNEGEKNEQAGEQLKKIDKEELKRLREIRMNYKPKLPPVKNAKKTK